MRLTQLGADGLAPYDLVITGTSFAALPIASAFAARGRVLLIEGGDVDERDDARELTGNDEYGHFTDGHWASHWIRATGGTSRRWSGVVVAPDPGDFAGGRGRPSWPITRADLDQSYRDAAEWLRRPAVVCAPGVPFGDALVARPLSHDTPLRLPDEVLRLSAGSRIDLLTRHTLVRLTSARRRVVEGMVITGPARRTDTHAVRPGQRVVLACGGLGNAQVLLQPSESGVPVGNESGLVGRFLMEHPHVVAADVLVKRSALPPLPDGFGPGLPAFRLPDAVMERHDLLACSLAIQGPIEAPPDTAAVHAHFESRFGGPLEWAGLFARAEQEPDAANRVQVLPETNWAGSHRLRTHCSLSSRDLRSMSARACWARRSPPCGLVSRGCTTAASTARRSEEGTPWARRGWAPRRPIRSATRRCGCTGTTTCTWPAARCSRMAVPPIPRSPWRRCRSASRRTCARGRAEMDAISRRRFLAGTSALPSLGMLTPGTSATPAPPQETAPRALDPCPYQGAPRLDDAPVSGNFVDYEGWIVTAEDRDALRAARREPR